MSSTPYPAREGMRPRERSVWRRSVRFRACVLGGAVLAQLNPGETALRRVAIAATDVSGAGDATGEASCLVFHEAGHADDPPFVVSPIARDGSLPSNGAGRDVDSKQLAEALDALSRTQQAFRARWGTRLARVLQRAEQAVMSSNDRELRAAAGQLSDVVAGPDSDARILDAVMSEILTMALETRSEAMGRWGLDLSEAQFASGNAEVIRQLERAVAKDPLRVEQWRALLAQARQNALKGLPLVDVLHEQATRARATGDVARALRIELVETALRDRSRQHAPAR